MELSVNGIGLALEGLVEDL